MYFVELDFNVPYYIHKYLMTFDIGTLLFGVPHTYGRRYSLEIDEGQCDLYWYYFCVVPVGNNFFGITRIHL